MFCPKCGAQLPDGSKFCAKCGAKIAAAQPAGGAPAPGPAPAPTPVPGPLPQPKKNVGALAALAVAAVVIVAIAVFALRGCGAKGYGSADELAQSIGNATEKLFEEDLSSGSLVSYTDGLLDMLPEGAPEAMMKEQGITSRDEFTSQMQGALGGLDDVANMLSGYLDKIDVSVDVKAGDSLDPDEIADINDGLSGYGLALKVTEARELTMSATVTLKEDFMGLKKGETQTQDSGDLGLYAVKIDGRWFLWSGSF